MTALGLPISLRREAEVLGAGPSAFSALVIARQATRDLLDMVRSRRRRATTPVADAAVSAT